MYKKILLTISLGSSLLGFSQTTLTNSYQPPQTIVNGTVRMLPGFHANSGDGNYSNGGVFHAKTGNSSETTAPAVVYNPSVGENYVYSRTYLVPVTSSNDYVPQIQQIQYLDGLGRPKQNVSIKASKSGKDLVIPVEFGDYGRQPKNYLPIPVPSLNGNIQPTKGSDVNSYYQTEFQTGTAFSENVLDESPLNRLMQTAFPGDEWKKGSTHTVDYAYNLNTAGDAVKKYAAVTAWDSTEEIYKSTLLVSASYAASQLYKNRTTDEDRNVQEIYKNSFGQTILIRKNDGISNIDTYYVYDDYDHLSFIITPKADLLALSDPTFLTEFCYQYNYDEWGRLAEKKLPGKEWDFFGYDQYDRLVATQDSKMKADGKWQFTKFDFLGRVAYTGIVTAGGRKDFQSSLDNSNSTEGEANVPAIVNGLSIPYTNQSFPSAISELLSVNVYDYYPTDAPAITSPILGQPVLTDDAYTSSISTMSLTTASYLKNIGEDKWTKSYVWYDTNERSIATHTKNHLGGFTRTESELDFAGIPKKIITKNSRTSPTNPDVTIEENFTYDKQYRIKKHEHEVVGRSPKETLAEYVYNDIGQLIVKRVGGSGNALQKVNYRYNIRGWLTGTNDLDSLNTNNQGDLFAYKIRYNDREGLPYPSNDFPTYQVKKRYNGNIAEVDWISLGDPGQIAPAAVNAERYGYVYDGLDRLKAGFYQKPFDRGNGENNEIVTEYDLNGNIGKLKRFARRPKSNIPSKIDDLQYNYTGNLLTSVIDNPAGSPNPIGYEGGGATIKYDINGNMTVMPDKGITNIDYNFLNLPTSVAQRGNATQYTYRADGQKLKRTFTLNNALGSTITNTEYIDGFHYSEPSNSLLNRALKELDDTTQSVRTAGNEEVFIDVYGEENRLLPGNPEQFALGLMFFPTAEGFYDFRNKQYIYQYKDQVGNIRLSYWVHPEEKTLKVLDRNDYYPFGMNIIQESEFSATTSPLNYKFQEQELQETGFYAFKWRQYMPDLGRFFNVDPLSEKYAYQSHYNFSENRVVNSREIEGLEAYDNADGSMEVNNYYLGADEFTRGGDGVINVKEVIVKGHKSDNGGNGDNDLEEHESNSGYGDVFRLGAGFVPILGSGLDIYDGIKNGNGWLIGMGVVGLSIDVATLGTGSLLKGGIKTIGTELAEEGLELATKELVEDVVETSAKEGAEEILKDGMQMSSNKALEMGEKFLEKGYNETVQNSGRYMSKDGKRVFRMGESDITGAHGGGPHVNFETLKPNPVKPGKMKVDSNIHVYLNDVK